VINGKVKNVSPLPAIPVGRQKLVRREALDEWKKSNEKDAADGMIPPSKIDAVRRMEEASYA
jgi:hypothetical protein